MSIKVVCGCGCATLLPDEWKGKRVRCPCGRSFVVGEDGALAEPPVPLSADNSDAPGVVPDRHPAWSESGVPSSAAPHAEAAPLRVPRDSTVTVADSLHRARQTVRRRRRVVMACGSLLVAAASTLVLLNVLRDHGWSVTAMLEPRGIADTEAVDTLPGEQGPPLHAPLADADHPAADTATHNSDDEATRTEGQPATRLANLTPLAAEDGLLLTGLFGDAAEQLQLSPAQHDAIRGVVVRLQEAEQQLQDKSVALDRWYAETRRLGDELLALLTDAQRQQLQVLLERGPLARVQLVEYAARMLPELGVAHVPWSAPNEGLPFRDVTTAALTHMTGNLLCRPCEPSGIWATLAKPANGDSRATLAVWDVATSDPLGRWEIESNGEQHRTVVSRDGTHVVVVREATEDTTQVEVWATSNGSLIASRPLPAGGDDRYTVRECVGQRVIALARQGYWVWDFQADEAQEIGFPESRPDISPGAVVSPRGQFLFVAHRHVAGSAPDTRYFIEVCVYAVQTGELLGNQVLHHDYRNASVTAMTLSHDGRELALLWDFEPPHAARKLVQLHASSGKIIQIVDGLPPADQGYAQQHDLADRDLICLPENAGWVVNLARVVDAETGAVLELNGLSAPPDGDTQSSPLGRIVDVLPTGDGRLLIISATPAPPPEDGTTLHTQSLDLPKLGPFQ